jgi:hypothetical protein
MGLKWNLIFFLARILKRIKNRDDDLSLWGLYSIKIQRNNNINPVNHIVLDKEVLCPRAAYCFPKQR